MKNTYDICILGATALAAGIIAANPAKRIVVLETSSTIAGEFGDAWKSDNAAAYAAKTDAAAALRAEFVRRKALTDAGEWIPAIQPILADDIKTHGADVYFFAALKEIAAKDGAYAVTFNAFGINHNFTAAKIIDTTARFIARPFLGGDAPETSVALHHIDPEFNVYKTPCRDIKEGRAAIVRDYTNILKIASELAYSPAEARRDMGAAAWVPSSHYGNFLAAYDAGAALTLPEGAAQTIVTETVDEGEYDIILVGLGTAGGIAAVAALEEGLKVLGLENLSVAGGAGTAGNVLWPYFGFKGGIYMDLNRRGHARDGIFYPTNGDGADQKIVELDASMKGADFRYGVQFTDVICEKNRVVGAVWYEAGVRHEARAKFVIDTSADSAACVSAGCAMLGGRDSDGRFQPYSSMYFRLANGRICGGYVDNGRMNQYDPDEFGSGIVNASASYVHLREDYSARDYLGVAPLIGLREGLRIVGEETVEFPALIAGGWHRKPAYYGWSNLDNHGKDNVLESRIYQDWNTVCGMWGWGMSLPIPMGALIPKGWDGILAAGRNVSVDHDIAMGVRMKDDVQKSGEAAVRLAALAIRGGIPAREVDLDALRAKLYTSGCLKAEDEVIRIEKQRCDEVHKFPLWCYDDDAIAAGLATDAPAYFMWSAKTLGKRALLESLLDSDDENARTNAALALTLLDASSEKIVAILAASALKRDGYIAKAGRKYIAPRSIAAISALGRIAGSDAVLEALPALYTLMADESFIEALPFAPYDFMGNREDYYFQYRSHLITTLAAIAGAHPEKACEIKEKLRAYADGKSLTVTMMGPVLRYDNTATLCRMIDEI